jgi:hypothetical protein
MAFSFHRSGLAKQFCDALIGESILDARAGMFLAAPRRVGKSTFLREDLVPEILARQWLPVYVDLWANRDADPAILIIEAIKTELLAFDNGISKTVKRVGLTKITVAGISMDLRQAGLPENFTLSMLLGHLHISSGKPVVLIVDEAQQALKTSSGLTLMFALKAARDHLNRSHEQPRLMLVFTGSQRDKLAHLVLKKDQPFFGANITSFPLLSLDFVTQFTIWANGHFAQDNRFSVEAVYEAFKLVGNRPEMLRTIIGQVALAGEAENLSSILASKATEIHTHMWDEMANAFAALTPLQKAVMKVLIRKHGKAYQPFSEDAMTEYRRNAEGESVTTAGIQSTLDILRDRGLIWNPSRGIYALEDEGYVEWYRYFENSLE